jgi:hypothetical protein
MKRLESLQKKKVALEKLIDTKETRDETDIKILKETKSVMKNDIRQANTSKKLVDP